MKKIYLLSQTTFNLMPNTDIISLSPKVSYELLQRNITYRVIRDFCSEAKLRQGEDAYFHEQLVWIHTFDRLLSEKIDDIQEKKICPAYYYFSPLKYLLDTWVISAIELKYLVKNLNVGEIIYCGPTQDVKEQESLFDLRHIYWKYYPLLLELFCTQREIKLTYISADTESKQSPESKAQAASPRPKLIKALRGIFHHLRLNFSFYRQRGKSKMNVLSLDMGNSSIDDVLKRLLQHGADIWVKSSLQVLHLNSFTMPEEALALKPITNENLFRQAAIEMLSLDSFWQLINKKADLPLNTLLTPFLKNFIECVSLKMLQEYNALETFHEKVKFDYIVARASSGINYPAALNLGFNHPEIKTICFSHSCGPTLWLDWIHAELDYFDYYVATDKLSANSFSDYAQADWIRPCKVFESSHYLKSIKKIVASKPKTNAVRETILYIPRKSPTVLAKFNTHLPSIPELFELQCRIIDLFGSLTTYNFIYKHAPSDWADDSILPYIKNKNYANVSVETGPPVQFFHKVDRAIFDFPSTGLFETLAADLPSYSLIPGGAKRLIPKMEDFFNGIIFSYETHQDAVTQLKNYLSGPAPRKQLILTDQYAIDEIFKETEASR